MADTTDGPDHGEQRTVRVDSYRPGRNHIRVGDPVAVKPSRPGRRDGFVGPVYSIDADSRTGEIVTVTVCGAPPGRPRAFHALRPDRIARVAKTRAGQPSPAADRR